MREDYLLEEKLPHFWCAGCGNGIVLGSIIRNVVQAAGAPFVARGTVVDVVQLDRLIGQALDHKGFSLVEVVSPCPTHYGKLNKLGDAAGMMGWIKDHTVSVRQAEGMSPEDLAGKYVTGVFADREQEDYSTAYGRVIDALKGIDSNE